MHYPPRRFCACPARSQKETARGESALPSPLLPHGGGPLRFCQRSRPTALTLGHDAVTGLADAVVLHNVAAHTH